MSSDPHAPTPPTAPEPIRYRIRRWPAALLVQKNEPERFRMASLLVRQPLSMDELADLSGQTLVCCADFLQALHEQDVLEVHVPPIRVEEAPTQPGELPPHAPTDMLASSVVVESPGQVRHPH